MVSLLKTNGRVKSFKEHIKAYNTCYHKNQAKKA